MISRTVGVIGQGFVGGSLTTAMSEKGVDVFVYDKTGKVAEGGKQPFFYDRMIELAGLDNLPPENPEYGTADKVQQFVHACESESGFVGIYFVCLPTPMKLDGSCDTSIVESVLTSLSTVPGNRIAVVKSTVPPGSTERWNDMFKDTGLRVVFSPEFLREATALDDTRNQTRIVIGGPTPAVNKVKLFCESIWSAATTYKTTSSNAEMVKYVTNVHLATKVALANEFYQICAALAGTGVNIDYDDVVRVAITDERLGKSHWSVPGPMPSDDTGEPAFGFGGSCFVKDINALMSVAKQHNVQPTVMSGAWAKNLEVRPQRDWEKLQGRAVTSTIEQPPIAEVPTSLIDSKLSEKDRERLLNKYKIDNEPWPSNVLTEKK